MYTCSLTAPQTLGNSFFSSSSSSLSPPIFRSLLPFSRAKEKDILFQELRLERICKEENFFHLDTNFAPMRNSQFEVNF